MTFTACNMVTERTLTVKIKPIPTFKIKPIICEKLKEQTLLLVNFSPVVHPMQKHKDEI